MGTLGKTILFIGIIAMGISTAASVGYGLYLWAHELTFALAAWTAFVLWLKMVIGGFVLVIVGAVMAE